MQAKEKDEKKKTVILIIMLLIALIIIIFLLINSFGKIDNNVKIPTGNVDIFDIVFENNNNKCDYNNCTCQYHKNNTIIGNTTQNDIENIIKDNSGVIVYDNEKKYLQSTPLNIFTQTSYYVVNDVIAPASENSYQFVIRNHNKFNIKYNLEIIEKNEYNINMKFKLKLNGVYVAGDENTYVSADELNQYDIILSENNYNVYTLDWKWIESNNDTEIGTNVNSNYKLNLKISASQY